MLKETSSNHTKNTYSGNNDIAKENIICKDGFCSLQNQKDIPKQEKNDLNLFDPV